MHPVAKKVKAKIKHDAKDGLRRLGWEVQRSNSGSRFPPLTSLHTAMTALLSCQSRLKVVQVGANDGVFNDPLYSFLMQYRHRTEILLIEPQPYLIPVLASNYKDHPYHTLANYAVGQPGTLVLHAVDERCWQDCHPPYAHGWPVYRAPTGITSADRDYVLQWLRQHYTGPLPIEAAIRSFSIESLPLADLMANVGFDSTVDVLQVDAEGFDDEVLYQSSLETLAPKIINFENANLTRERFERLVDHLIQRGYVLQSTRSDTLAIKGFTTDLADTPGTVLDR